MGTGGHGVGDAMRDGTCFASARPREDHDRALHRLRRGPLFVVEAQQQGFRVRHTLIVARGCDLCSSPVYGVHMSDDPMVTMFSTVWCGYCQRLKAQMGREGIAYLEVDIEQDPEAAAFVENINSGNQTVPTLLFSDGTTMTNPPLRDVTAKVAALQA